MIEVENSTNSLSELDKVSLNIVYPPALVPEKYDPQIGKTGLYYWGRKAMENHNFPDDDITDGIWGPESGPNWPAWRVLKTGKMDELNKNGKFQGYSGMVYCGKKMKKSNKWHDGVCGPDNGSPWIDCMKIIFDETELKKYLKKIKKSKKFKWIIF